MRGEGRGECRGELSHWAAGGRAPAAEELALWRRGARGSGEGGACFLAALVFEGGRGF